MKLKMQNTLRMIGLYPVIILFIFSSYILYTSYTQYNKAVLFEKKLNLEKVLRDLSVDVAKERGLSSVFIASNGHLAKEALNKQRLILNDSIKKLYNYYKNTKPDTNIRQIISLLNNLKSVRKKIDSLKNISFDKIFFSYYSRINKYLLNEIGSIKDIITNSKVLSLQINQENLFNDMEYSGQERGFISKIISQYIPFTENDAKIWLKITSRIHTFDYNDIEDPASKMKIYNLYNSKENKKILEDTENARKDILLTAKSGEYIIDPTLWFGLMTKNIQILKKSSQIVQNSLSKELENYKDKNIEKLILAGIIWLISIIFLILGFILSKQFKNNMLGLQSIFSKIEELAETKQEVDFSTSEGVILAYQIIDKAVENIAKEKDSAKEASAAKSIFLANMSHEIRTPLNGIVGFTELLKGTDLDDEKREFVDVIEKSSENLLAIINNILDLSKVESNRIEIDEILFPPIEEFENAIEVYGPKAAEKGIHLSAYIDPNLNKYIKGDATKIKEVLINLLSNAVKFTKENGYITTEIKKVDGMPEGKTKIYFSVQDTGIGIEKDKLKDIFSAFSQADSTITRKFGGTGLGLTISSKYIEMMGGNLKVESEPGKGSKFFFTLEFDESSSTSENYMGSFSEYNCAVLSLDDKPKPQSQFIYNYFNYFGSSVKFYSNFNNLKNLIYRSGYNIIVADFEDLNKDEIDEYRKIKLPIIIILKATQQSKFDSLKTKYITPIYEPVNMSKIIKILKANVNLLPQKEVPKVKAKTKSTYGEKFNANVLVAEDNEINQKLITRTLQDLGLHITLAANGLEALEKRKQNDYDLIFMDIAMPVMDGIIATQEILKYENEMNIPHIPIVAITANALKGDRERFMKEGLDEYITKPIKKDSILNVLNMFIPDKIDQQIDETDDIIVIPNIDEQKNINSGGNNETTVTEEQKIIESNENNENKETAIADTTKNNILVFKKSSIETKIFSSIISKMYKDVDTAKNIDDFKEKIENNFYKLILFDKEIDNLKTSEISKLIKDANLRQQIGSTKTILFFDSTTHMSEEEKLLFDVVTTNSINKNGLDKLIKENI